MNEEKICPLLSVSQDRRSGDLPEGVGVAWAYCQEVNCAWYIPPANHRQEGRCAVQYLGVLPALCR